jgi:hypothetical protein
MKRHSPRRRRAVAAGIASAMVLLFGSAAIGNTVPGTNPYVGIVRRNAFALRPPAPLPAPQPAISCPVELFLTGISTLAGRKEVLLEMTEKTPGKKAEFLPALQEGEVQGRVEVVKIDAARGAVVVKVDGQDRKLTFEANAPKEPPAPAVATAARWPARIPVPVSLPPAAPRLRSLPLVSHGVVIGGAGTPGSTAATTWAGFRER